MSRCMQLIAPSARTLQAEVGRGGLAGAIASATKDGLARAATTGLSLIGVRR